MSESEEMYLVTLVRLQESGAAIPIPVAQLAAELSIQPVSASQMIHKLEESGLVAYTPYKGAALTPEGERLALRILRHRRLWEVFLVEHLKMIHDEADDLACKLEHAIPAEAVERLAGFLGNPTASPQGKPIPKATLTDAPRSDILLCQLKVGQQGQVMQVDTDTAARAFLSHEGIQTGAIITVMGIGNDGAILVGIDGRSVFLGEDITGGIWVKSPDLFSANQ